MTVQYSDREPLRTLRVLLTWKGSVWKQILREYALFLILYFIINISYRWGMTPTQQFRFEKLVMDFETWHRIIPLTFLIGFYVSTIFSRWWQQLNFIAWPDKLLVTITANLKGSDHKTRLIRRTYARYCNLLNVLVWKEVSLKVKKRFPTDEHVLRAGLMTQEEYELYTSTSGKFGKWFIPVSWMMNLTAKCKKEELLEGRAFAKIVEEIFSFRTNSAMLALYDWINVPLVYTQVVTLATYGYFFLALIARQTLYPESTVVTYHTDIVFPVFTTLEFIFFVGWMKVGTELRSPFGDDDEDFNMNYVLDRNMHVSMMLVDTLEKQEPSLSEDIFWDAKEPELPHTVASEPFRDSPPSWRLSFLKLSEKEQKFLHEVEEPKNRKNKNSTRETFVLPETVESLRLTEHA